MEQVANAIRDDTILVSVMLANNEIGAIQPLAEIGHLCKQRDVLLHTDATQAVGKIPVDVEQLQVDLMSFTAHKIYGPKGVGALYVRRRNPQMRLEPLDRRRRAGIGLAQRNAQCARHRGFRPGIGTLLAGNARRTNSTASTARSALSGLSFRSFQACRSTDRRLNLSDLRLPGNLNVSFDYVDGETLLANLKDIALSSGSACTSANPEPSHVLRALGLSEETVRGSVRFGLGRFNTAEEVDYCIDHNSRYGKSPSLHE